MLKVIKSFCLTAIPHINNPPTSISDMIKKDKIHNNLFGYNEPQPNVKLTYNNKLISWQP